MPQRTVHLAALRQDLEVSACEAVVLCAEEGQRRDRLCVCVYTVSLADDGGT